MKKIFKKTLITALAFSAHATEYHSQEFIEESLLIALPELNQKNVDASTKSLWTLDCFVDTPAYDQFTSGACTSSSWAYSTSAVFSVNAIPSSTTTLNWSDSRCDNNSHICILPITHHQTIHLKVGVNTGTFSYLAYASATYESML